MDELLAVPSVGHLASACDNFLYYVLHHVQLQFTFQLTAGQERCARGNSACCVFSETPSQHLRQVVVLHIT